MGQNLENFPYLIVSSVHMRSHKTNNSQCYDSDLIIYTLRNKYDDVLSNVRL